MILPSINDHHCLGQVLDRVKRMAVQSAIIELANRFRSPRELAAYLRTRPQQLDFGDPGDGPRIACVPSQRLRFLPPAYNCLEGTANYLTIAEAMDPSTPRTACTIRVGTGYHTFPIENGRAVILDPAPPPRNAIDAGVYECQRNGGLRPSLIEARESHRWLIRVAAQAAQTPCEAQYVRNAVAALNRSMVRGQPLQDLGAIAHTIALAETDAGLWGQDGIDALEYAARSVRNLQQGIDLGTFKSLATRLGKDALKAYVVAQTGPAGLAVLQVLDQAQPAKKHQGRSAERLISALSRTARTRAKNKARTRTEAKATNKAKTEANATIKKHPLKAMTLH